MSISPKLMPTRDGSVDLLRAAAMVYVVAYLHLGGYIGSGNTHVWWWTPTLTTMILGVFTFLSGYVLGQSTSSGSLAHDLKQFYVRRFLRVYPLYIVALTAFVYLWLTDPWSGLKAAIGVSMFFPEAPMTLWYVAMILVCYAIAPMLLMFSGFRAALLAAIAWVAMIVCHLFVHEMDVRLLTHFPAFVAGVFFRRIDLRSVASRHKVGLIWSTTVCFAFALAAQQWPLLGAVCAIPLVMLAPVALLVMADARFDGLANSRFVGWLSYASFAAYLYHRVVFELLVRNFWSESTGTQVAILLAVGLPLILAISTIIQILYDSGLEAARRHWSYKLRAA